MKKIKAVEIVLFVCLLLSCFMLPRFVTSQLLSGITTHISFSAYLDEAYPREAEMEAKIEAKKARDAQIGPLIDAETLPNFPLKRGFPGVRWSPKTGQGV